MKLRKAIRDPYVHEQWEDMFARTRTVLVPYPIGPKEKSSREREKSPTLRPRAPELESK